MAETIKIRDIEAKPGEKAYGFLKIGETASTEVKIPVAIVNGSEPGPKLCLTAAVHCTEYEGVEAAIRTFQDTNPAELKGALIICPVINTPGFQHGTLYVNPLDGKNMNRVYPGKKDGTISDMMIYTVFNELIRICDAHIDLHGGEPVEDHGLYIIYCVDIGNKEVEERSKEMAMHYNCEILNEGKGHPGTSATEVSKIGIPSITPEAGALALYREKDIQFHYTGIKNIMKLMGMLPKEGPPAPPVANQKVCVGAPALRINNGGIFHPYVAPDEWFKKGDVLAEIKDMFGNVLEQVIAPEDGIIGLTFSKRVKTAGENAFLYLKLKE